MNIYEFIEKNRGLVDDSIAERLGAKPTNMSDQERRLWVLNDEGLYFWAKAQGVDV